MKKLNDHKAEPKRIFSVGTEINRTINKYFRGNQDKHLPPSSPTESDKRAHGSLRILNDRFAHNHISLRIPLRITTIPCV